MLITKLNSFSLGTFLIEQSNIVILLSIVVVFFTVLLLLGVRKSYLLKKENDQLDTLNNNFDEDDTKPYKDFTEGHMYQQKNDK
ncbi:hypothetical protein SAMN05428642_102281 [Flaviramulus basaltis]|uniref:Uncharacterized protein n=1 Tax=Flaviramulus basaltis TaxID=369401 RepID=A0A1K2IHG6_9FLAO|nr:hypothetical protein [Flaviramulus basaltis]SFZ91742.1 hypothetical protein SAMN05428642_102281 [Flaviramulus basaltis]